MADEIKRKRVTLHPLKKDGTLDLYTNLYPKCLDTGIVDENGNEVKVLTTEGSETFDQAIARLQSEIDEKGDVTEEKLQEVIAHVEDDISGKQDTIDDLEAIRSGAAAGAAAVSQDDFNNAIDEIDNHITVIAENQLPCWNLSFSLKSSSYQTDVPQPDDNEPWMHSEDTYDNQPIILSINGGTPEFCFISKTIEGDHNDNIYIRLYNSRWYIEMTYIPSEVQFDWTLDLSCYFGNKTIRDDFYPAIRFINNELDDDNVIMPSWVQDIDIRMRTLTRIEVPAILYKDNENDIGEPVTIYAIPDINDNNQVIVHIHSSEGDYKLTYQYHEDEEGE